MAELKRREKDIEFQNKITLAITDHDSDHEYFFNVIQMTMTMMMERPVPNDGPVSTT